MGGTQGTAGRVKRALQIGFFAVLVLAVLMGYLSYSGGLYKIPFYNNVIRPISSIVPSISSLPAFAGSSSNSSTTTIAKTTTTATTTVRPVAVLYITNSSQTMAIRVMDSTVVDVTGNYDNLTIYSVRGATIYLNVASNYNNILIVNATVYLNVNGNYNTVRVRNSTVTNSQITGMGDSIGSA